MKTTDLRIGNTVGYGKVVSISSTLISVEVNIPGGKKAHVAYSHDEIFPVLITAKTLKQLEFKRKGALYEKDSMLFEFEEGMGLILSNISILVKPCKFLHELQNLYYVLYDEELIKP